MKISKNGVSFIAGWEGLELEAYQDIADIWTIGYGHTGPEVTAGMKVTEEQARSLLEADLEYFERGLNQVIRGEVNQNQFDALVSLTYNIGLGAFRSSTVLKRLNKGDYEGAAEAITWWNKATINGQLTVVNGLTNRRTDERKLFLTPAKYVPKFDPSQVKHIQERWSKGANIVELQPLYEHVMANLTRIRDNG